MGTLYIVATPIGNLEDITLRAVRMLREADRVLAEDTRVTKKLLAHYGIKTPLFSYRQHSGRGVIEKILEMLEEGKNLALVTDAGTPGVADPGNKLVEEVMRRPRIGRFAPLRGKLGDEVRVVPIPGPSALTALASVAGISMDRFCFLGYPPAKKGRKKFFEEVAYSNYPVILYESPHRILRTLTEISEALKLRNYATTQQRNHETTQLIVGRELTKKFETILRGTIAEVLQHIARQKPQGEYTIIVAAKEKSPVKKLRFNGAD